jgi:acetolactate synthase-1/2/3 large subunit
MTETADILARAFYQAGCRYAFGMPGGEVLRLLRALEEAGIAFHLAKHETPAGFMAEGAYHMTGAPGILLATLGPGVTNAVNAVANAFQDRVPLLFVTGCVDPPDQEGYTHQVFDHGRLLAPVVKGSFTLVDGAVEIIAEKALRLATEGRPGPVHIDVPISLAGRAQPAAPPVRPPRLAVMEPAPGPDLEQAKEALARAERPLIVAGMEVLHQGAEAALAALVESHSLPLITTYKAKGVVDENHPLVLGGAGLSPLADEVLLPLVAEADFVLLAGYDPIEMRHGWKRPWDPGRTTVVELTGAPNYHGMHQAGLSLVGSIARGLARLSEGATPKARWSGGEIEAARAALAERFPADEAWGPAAVVEEVRRALPADGVASADSGAHRILLSQIWRCPAPRTLLQSSGFCTMGPALPLAIGAKLAAPRRPVVAFTGDAGLEMVLGELATLRDLALPVTVVVFVDASLALIELKQRDRGDPNRGVDFGATDFPAVAQALGGHGVAVSDRAALRAALGASLAADRFTVIAAEIGAQAYDGRF